MVGTMLDATAARLGIALSDGARDDILGGCACLPAYAEVVLVPTVIGGERHSHAMFFDSCG